MTPSEDGGLRRMRFMPGVEPERRLAWAILDEAASSAMGRVVCPGKEMPADVQAMALAWFRSRQDFVFSFTFICDVLGLDASAVFATVKRGEYRRGSPRSFGRKRRIGGRRDLAAGGEGSANAA